MLMSIGCPYCRESPGTTYILFNNGTEKQLATLTQEESFRKNRI